MQIDGTLSPTFKTAPKSDDYGAKNFLNIDEIIRNEYLNIVKKMLSLGINGLFENKQKTLEDIFYHFINNNQYMDDNDVVPFMIYGN